MEYIKIENLYMKLKVSENNGKMNVVYSQKWKRGICVREKLFQSGYSKWLEGLVLLIVLGFFIMMAMKTQPQYHVIQEQAVSKWSGSIDNLE